VYPAPGSRCKARGPRPEGQSAVYQERKTSIGGVSAANPHGRHRFPDDSTDSSGLGVNLQRLKWVGPHVFKARYGARLGLDRDSGVWRRPRHDQLMETTTEAAAGVEL